MEKYGVADDDAIAGLRDEEHQLMTKVSAYMTQHEKTASEEDDFRRTESRLHQVRNKITEYDLKKMKGN